MKLSTTLLKAPHVGIRDLKAHFSKLLKDYPTMIITDRGKPKNVIVSYNEILELIDIIDEITDKTTLNLVQEGRKAINKGSKGVPVSELFSKMRKH